MREAVLGISCLFSGPEPVLAWRVSNATDASFCVFLSIENGQL